MKKEFSEIVCVIDRSGSMEAIVNDAIGGFNTFLEEQKKLPGEATLTYVQFDTEYEVIHENKPLAAVPQIDHDTYQPRGATALLDAIGRTIDMVGKRLSNTSEEFRPKKVIFAILTDGEENFSRKYDLVKVKNMIEHQKFVYGWDFIFLAANQDAFAEAAKLGINPADTVAFTASSTGVRAGYGFMSQSVARYRS